jgi:hypothetical protein
MLGGTSAANASISRKTPDVGLGIALDAYLRAKRPFASFCPAVAHADAALPLLRCDFARP